MRKLITFHWQGKKVQHVVDYIQSYAWTSPLKPGRSVGQCLQLVERMPGGTVRSMFYDGVTNVTVVTLLEPAAILNSMQTLCHLTGAEWMSPDAAA